MFDFVAFIRQKWVEYSPSRGQRGTVIDDLAVKPTGLVLQDFYNSLVKQRRINNVINWEEMSDEELDFFGNKFFMPRTQGDYSHGYIRIYFDRKLDLNISSSFRASAGNGKKYKAIQTTFISKNSFKQATDGFALYYVDVPIIAETQGNSYNVPAGNVTQLENVGFVYKMVTNPEAIKYGSRRETNEEYVTRLQYSLNDRSMMNKRSIFAKLPEFFPTVTSIYVAAPGDKYMQRDLVEAVDVSAPSQKIDFLGKLKGENIVKHAAYFGIYPPEPDNVHSDFMGPFSIYSDYPFWLTIDPTDLLSTDPAYHGFPIDQEFTDDMYKGMFFDDFKTFMELSTKDLFNIYDENAGFDGKLAPNEDWIYGAVGEGKGNFGTLPASLTSDDILEFNYNEIRMSAGSPKSISIGKNINKRVGVKMSGKFTWPEITGPDDKALNTNLQFIVGGTDDNFVEGYVGVGFGVRLTEEYETGEHLNGVAYITNSSKYGFTNVYATKADYDALVTNIGSVNALAETRIQIQPGAEYEFEFVLYDDLQTSLMITKSTPTSGDYNEFRLNLSSTPMRAFSGELLNKDSDSYGTRMKVTLDTLSTDNEKIWTIGDLKVVDVAPHKCAALFALNVKDIEGSASVYFRGSGEGAINGKPQQGCLVYVWDKEQSNPSTGTTELSMGGWSLLSGVSNPDGSKSITSNLLKHDIQSLSRYTTKSRFGEAIFFLVITSGSSAAQIRFAGSALDDVQSVLKIDYIKIESQNLNQYHANNKVDLHLVTTKNSDVPVPVTKAVTKLPNESFFEISADTGFDMPIIEIITVTNSRDDEVIASSDYSLIVRDPSKSLSSQESILIYVNGDVGDEIQVEYTTYPEIRLIQEFFDGPEYGKLFGNVLVKHKTPCKLDIPIFFTGDVTDDQLISAVRDYVDQNPDGTFSTKDLVSYLYNLKIVNNVKEPLTISYSTLDEYGNVLSGSFTDVLTINSISYFRIETISVNRL